MHALGSLPDHNHQPCSRQETKACIAALHANLGQHELLGKLGVAASTRGVYKQASMQACAQLASGTV
jgi:hypothetical protein